MAPAAILSRPISFVVCSVAFVVPFAVVMGNVSLPFCLDGERCELLVLSVCLPSCCLLELRSHPNDSKPADLGGWSAVSAVR